MVAGHCPKTHSTYLTRKMGLQLNEIKDRLKRPERSGQIQKAIRHENRLKFHVETFLDVSEASQQATIFLNWVKTLIPMDKYAIFLSLFKMPIPTVQLTNTIFQELERVFDGKNPVSNYQFTDSKYKDDWDWYRQNELKGSNVWRKKGWDTVKTSINSVLVVDLPEVQTGELPEPYFYFLDICHVIDYEFERGKIEWILFRQHDDKVVYIDELNYVTVVLDVKGTPSGEFVQAPHNLGYCPAQFFWSTELAQKEPDLKRSPLTAQLANLDWLLFFSISKRHLDLYAPYPIYSAYEADCDFKNNETGEYCDGGYLRSQEHHYKVLRDGTIEGCPICSVKRLAGAGSFVDVPAPTKDEPDMRNPVQITTIDADSLKYNVDEVNRLEEKIFTSVIGLGGDVQAKQSINTLQVSANFESKVSVLNSLKGNLEAAIKFVNDTCCRLRYGINFIGSSISMGTEFYIYSVSDLYNQYKQAKENGSCEAILDSIGDQIIDTEYRNNDQERQRVLTLKHLEPYRHYTFDELMTLQDKGLLNKDLLNIKINFSTFIDRFERENTNVLEFGSQLDFDKKINVITQKLKDYGREQNDSQGTSGAA